ncbi:hypothetical protein RsS62_23600 [Rhizobium dioscoreae]|uniref:hypothetical protein n=1 Tax=Rhizobium sp. ERR 1071 TaxID=2572677 RepID=UPI00119C8222|nr:hypothetical protein [Rhizobium sp. ERR1071]TWB11637.1 hypothetical protein FBZ99_10817 [Rhizobium sp. ERR1071]GES43108.1 hypothetical protein RsS62_23600 [Rhizobium dioscoreae]
MPKYKRLADVDLLLAIDRTRVEIEGQKQMVAKLVAAAVESPDESDHRRLVDMHILMRAMLESDLTKMEAEWQRRK